MKQFVKVDENCRITATTPEQKYADDSFFEFDFPDDFNFGNQTNYVIKDGELTYSTNTDPLIPITIDPVSSALKYMMRSMSFTSASADDIVGFRTMWPDWQPDTDYKQNDPLQYDEKYWRVSKDLTSSKVYPPGSSESLYYEVQLADDGVIIYRTCHGKYDSVRLGEKRRYPDADGPIYESLVDYNAYSPDAYPKNWKLVE